ncbi:tRNA (guanosine(46)-N7)-methyltransferase TrmB [Reyranella massiliensis]|jgi:tRNA (guanine-N7-)-methyltransferase|uniref:tRNA (guanosine(46)-N7)-methyltransferase TrmB n=1 Tax=Reyranella massiliensis TaxID=445220 RepID=UPI0002F589A6|nr:tRNA (guanosine(46)-N7)-methyltransferase TrmB [Reyranella massiliensis]
MEETRRRTLHGRRRGKKLRAGQQSLLDTLLPRLALDLPAEPIVTPEADVAESAAKIDLARLFGGTLPADGVWLEVGFGAGEHLVWQAEHHPTVGLIGCEPYINGVAKCLAHIERAGVGNVRLFTDDARFVMAALPAQSLSRAFVLFPDPWPKTRHHKRRFVQRDNLDVLARLMRPGAELRLATDDPSYLPWMVEHACLHPAFEWLAQGPADWRGRPADWPGTRYEQKMLAGHKPVFLRLRRR